MVIHLPLTILYTSEGWFYKGYEKINEFISKKHINKINLQKLYVEFTADL